MEKRKNREIVRRLAFDMIYSLTALVVMNMVLSLGVYPYLNRQLGDDGQGRMLFFTAIMGLVASAFGSGMNYGRMKSETRHDTVNGDYNIYLLAVAMISIIVTVAGFIIKKEAAGATVIGVAVLIFATAVRYYSDVEYRLELNYKGFFVYYMLIAAGYAAGIFLYPFTKSWVCIFLLGELTGIAYVAVTGHIYKGSFFKKSEYFKEDVQTCTSLSTAYLMSDFVSYADRVLLSVVASNTASNYFYISSLVGKMTSFISQPLNGVITGHLTRYNGKITKKMFTWVLAVLLVLAAVLSAATVLGSHIFVYLFYRDKYEIVKPLFILANSGQVFFFLCNTMMTVVLRFAPERYQMIMGVVYTVLFFAGVVPAMWFFKIWGAAWGLLIINVIKFLLITALGFRALSKQERQVE